MGLGEGQPAGVSPATGEKVTEEWNFLPAPPSGTADAIQYSNGGYTGIRNRTARGTIREDSNSGFVGETMQGMWERSECNTRSVQGTIAGAEEVIPESDFSGI